MGARDMLQNSGKRNLTDRALKALAKQPAPKGDTYDITDTVVPGFGVRVSETGRRTFILIARYPGSKNPTRRALGQYGALTLEQARHKARSWTWNGMRVLNVANASLRCQGRSRGRPLAFRADMRAPGRGSKSNCPTACGL